MRSHLNLNLNLTLTPKPYSRAFAHRTSRSTTDAHARGDVGARTLTVTLTCARQTTRACAQVVDFPAFIVCDDKGNDFFKEFNM